MVYTKGAPDQFPIRRTPASYGGSLAESISQVPLAVAVANRLLDGIGFTRLVNGMVEWDPRQCRVSPGDAIKSLIVNMASIKERPALLNVMEAYDNVPVGIMFDSVESPDNLNRYALARNLDRLYEAGPSRVYYRLAASLRAHYRIISRAAHSDTTSVNVWGEYESEFQKDGGIDITYGFSKDKRPDLKQYMVGNVVDENGISLFAKPLDGNTSDVTWNKECIDSIMDVLKRDDLIYVADSKASGSSAPDRPQPPGI